MSSQPNSKLHSDFLEPEITSKVDTMRHSAAHIMAHAIQKIWPKARFGIGPTIENGFYYDFDIEGVKLTPENLQKIENVMKNVIKENHEFKRTEHRIDDAIEYFKSKGQNFKVEIISDLKAKGETTVSTYAEGEFTDLCRGPHVKTSGEIGSAFKLMSLAGAYWRGKETNPMLTRIYGVLFETQAELDEYIHFQEEAKKRDHRKLGKELDLFSFIPEAPASPFFHPKGTTIYNQLVKFMRDLYVPYGYTEVITPQILDVQLWKTSGHYDNYVENMYFTEIDERQFAVKPMNCPAHTFIYSSNLRSYRDLPLRYADFGRLHRYEKSGVTAGLTRVRTFCQDDGHIFCTPEQIENEILRVMDLLTKVYEFLEFKDFEIALSTRPEKRVGSDALWDTAENGLKKVLDKMGRKYVINAGDGAFYGPKIDFRVSDALKRKHQLATIQLDFNLGARFKCEYKAADNSAQTPVVIHRAILGSLERFIGVYIEHVAGAFPFWMAPVQARIVPIKDTHNAYAHEFARELTKLGMRVEVDDRNESMGLKTREAQMQKIPFSLAAGDREIAGGQFAVRKYGAKDNQVMTKEEILKMFKDLNDAPLRVVEAARESILASNATSGQS